MGGMPVFTENKLHKGLMASVSAYVILTEAITVLH
jgi:hypothetical protein